MRSFLVAAVVLGGLYLVTKPSESARYALPAQFENQTQCMYVKEAYVGIATTSFTLPYHDFAQVPVATPLGATPIKDRFSLIRKSIHPT